MTKENYDEVLLQQSIIQLAQHHVPARDIMRGMRALHPGAGKKAILRAAFGAVIAMADNDIEKALMLQDFAIKERGSDK